MGIQLDWQIEADSTQQQYSEDPENRKRRRRMRWQLLTAMAFVALVVCGVISFLVWRVNEIEQRVEDNLRAAVEAELAAIRIGNFNAYMDIQRSASPPFIEAQRNLFTEYQTLKQAGRLSPETNIVSIDIDEQRGRVIIEEEIDGLRYQQAWFYWNYEPETTEGNDPSAGWRHVPQDWTFWGDENTITRGQYSLTYYDLDAQFAEPLAERLDEWIGNTCQWMTCTALPDSIEIIIDPEAGIRQQWEPENGWRLRVLSPLVSGRVPLESRNIAEQDIVESLTERLMDNATGGRLQFVFEGALIAFDTTWLKFTLRDWFMAQFFGTEEPFLDSITAIYGDAIIPTITQSINDGEQIDRLAPILNQSLGSFGNFDEASLDQIDWRPFFEWRLSLERTRLQNGDLDNFYALYENASANSAAQTRANTVNYATSPPETVARITFTRRPDATLIAVLDLTDAVGNTAQTSYVWVGNTFVRVD